MYVDAQDLATRYAAVWNEPDAKVRRAAVEELWAGDGVHVLHPPQEIREEAARLGFTATTLEARGHDAIEARTARAHEEFVAPGEYVFRAAEGSAVRLNRVVKFAWEMVPAGGGDAVGGGLEMVILDDDGRISEDYQFPG
ncbi:hypothetical protein HII36_44485 [Nonomuraea sp. NN258]|uniref:hypothetical protein n=1 Tax=Nonomuraea antri TaxID=2730852 RepID=UPI0015698832|nr:hypothetical protein [Nonomuraea antri]NRQ38834.1 hypothetical protein [Nonomuraea antri]